MVSVLESMKPQSMKPQNIASNSTACLMHSAKSEGEIECTLLAGAIASNGMCASVEQSDPGYEAYEAWRVSFRNVPNH